MKVCMNPVCVIHDPSREPTTDRVPGEVRRLARAFEQSAAGMALQTPEGVWIEVNPAFCRIVGRSRNELIGQSFTTITHADDIGRSLEQLHRLNSGELSSFRFDKRYIHAHGREVWVRLDVSMMRDDNGRPELIITQAHDITASRQVRQQLAENEARLHSIIKTMAEGVVVIDCEGRFTLGNSRAIEIVGLGDQVLQTVTLDDFNGRWIRPDGSLVAPQDSPVRMTLATGEPQREVQLGLTGVGERTTWIEISTAPIFDDDGDGVGAVVVTLSDITERLRTERALRQSEQRLSLALEGGKLGMWDWLLESGDFQFNHRALQILGYREGDVDSTLMAVRDLAHPADERDMIEAMEEHLKGHREAVEIDVRMRRSSGDYEWTHIRGRVSDRNVDGRPLRVTGVLIDISERKELERRLHELAVTDELTGLYNRRHGKQRLTDELERARRSKSAFGFILFDIDHFKRVNDRFGHDEGDRVLCEVAELLKSRVRRNDTAARWGGEEFAVVLPSARRAAATEIAGELLEAMAAIRLPDGTSISASFGVVESRHDDSVTELVKRADRLLYRAKEGGRSRVESGDADA